MVVAQEENDSWPLDSNGQPKAAYKLTLRLLKPDPLRRAYYERLKSRFPNTFLAVPLAAIVPQHWIKHLVDRTRPYYNMGSFFANRFHLVVCNADFRPVIAIDFAEDSSQSLIRQQFKEDLLTQVQVPYALLPRDEAFLFSEEVQEMVEKTTSF